MKHFSAARCSTLAVLVLLVCLQLAREAECTTFYLGGDAGWTNKADIDYNKWLSDYKIKIGDSLGFVNYDTTDHTYVLVDKLGYDTCGVQGQELSSLNTISGGGYGMTWTFFESGQCYIICALPGHCLQGMKVFVQVLNADGSVNQTAAAADAPKANSASATAGFSWSSQLLVVVVATFSVMVVATTVFA